MSNQSDDTESPRPERPRPKRGAFPTPKPEIEKATPYIPEDEPGECAESKPADPT